MMYMFFCFLSFFFFSSCVWNTLYFFMFGTSINKLKGAVIELLFTVFYCTSFPLVYFLSSLLSAFLCLFSFFSPTLFLCSFWLTTFPFFASLSVLFIWLPFLSVPVLSHLPFGPFPFQSPSFHSSSFPFSPFPVFILSFWSPSFPVVFLLGPVFFPSCPLKCIKVDGSDRILFKKIILNLSTDLHHLQFHLSSYCLC